MPLLERVSQTRGRYACRSHTEDARCVGAWPFTCFRLRAKLCGAWEVPSSPQRPPSHSSAQRCEEWEGGKRDVPSSTMSRTMFIFTSACSQGLSSSSSSSSSSDSTSTPSPSLHPATHSIALHRFRSQLYRLVSTHLFVSRPAYITHSTCQPPSPAARKMSTRSHPS